MREGWEYKKFEEVFDLQMGKTPSRDNPLYWGGQNTWVSISDLQRQYIDSSKENITDKAVSESNIKVVKKGTVIMSFKLTVGRCAITAKDLFTNEAIMSFTPKQKGVVSPEYIYYYLKGYKWLGANKAVMGLTLNKKSISTNVFSYPPLPEQERIVSELDLLSSIIEKKKAQLKEYDHLAQSIFYDMFGDPVENEKGWEVKKLSDISVEKLSYGSGASAMPYNEDVRYIRITDINDNGELNEDVVSPNAYDEKYILNEGDILFARSGATVGKTYCHKNKYGKCIYAGYLIRLIPNKRIVEPSYVFGYTKTLYYKKFVQKAQNAVAQPNINAKQYGDLLICIPPLSLQQSFAEKIEAIERQKELIKQSIAEAETLFNSRMEYYFN
ncbi:MAG: restriction endonuclease subunit S [Prevotella sp.]|nr:restriction endonuclease subunit S [Prevotella sp.]